MGGGLEMKQHISLQGLDQLTPAGKERLRAWYEKSSYYPEYGDSVINVYIPEIKQSHHGLADQRMIDDEGNELKKAYHYDELLPLLSIGQMIDFLDEKLFADNFDWGSMEILRASDGGWAFYDYLSQKYISPHNPELCDALWSACVELLNKE